MKMCRLGLFDDMDRIDESALLARINELRPLYASSGLWRSFKDWVSSHRPPGDSLSLAKLKAKSVVEVTSCEPHIVAQAFSTLEEMCERIHIIHEGKLVPSECSRMAVCDEKGFSGRPVVISFFDAFCEYRLSSSNFCCISGWSSKLMKLNTPVFHDRT